MALSWFQLTIRNNVPNSFWRHFRPYSIHFSFCYVSFNFLWNRCNHGEAKTIKCPFNFDGFSPNSSDSSNVVQPHHPASAVPWTSLQTLWRQHLGRCPWWWDNEATEQGVSPTLDIKWSRKKNKKNGCKWHNHETTMVFYNTQSLVGIVLVAGGITMVHQNIPEIKLPFLLVAEKPQFSGTTAKQLWFYIPL